MNFKQILRLSVATTGLSLFLSGTSAMAQIASDTFTDANGTEITDHSPDVNNTASSSYIINPSADIDALIQNDALAFPNRGSAALSLSGVTLPTDLVVSASLNLSLSSTVASESSSGGDFFGDGLGFYSATGSGQNFYNFTGLVLQANGNLEFVHFGTNFSETLYGSTAYSLGTFDATAFHNLTYTVDTATGGISDVSLTDANGTQTYSFASTPFTTAGFLNNVALYNNSGTNNSLKGGQFDNLLVGGQEVPEPSMSVLLGLGVCVFVLQMRRNRRSVNV